MDTRLDAIVVGTGFGGAITACRLAEAGARVLVLERGRRWSVESYPRRVTDPWLYHAGRPEKHNGWLDIRVFRGMVVAQGAGVGGGSLCYSSVVMEPDRSLFDDGWPPEVTAREMRPYYEKVRDMLAVGPIPPRQRTPRAQILQRAAASLGESTRVEDVPLAIAFDPDYGYDRPDPITARWSKPFVNAHGITQGTCVHLGNCDIGCDVQAKNTLDLNYLAAAERRGADVRPLHLVRAVEPAGTGYRVRWDEIRQGRLIPGEASADRVILAAGSLGSTEILLRSRDVHGTLPRVSARLGTRWSANANVLAPAIYPRSVEVQQGTGPTISAGLDFMDGSQEGERFFVEDDGFPNLLLTGLRARLRAGGGGAVCALVERWLRRDLDEKNPTAHVMVWLGEGLDAADGRLYLGRRWLAPWRRALKLEWHARRSRGVVNAILAMHRRLSDVEGGRLRVPWYWRALGGLVTVHPLGGCGMGRGPDEGVVDHRGEVFGHPRLYVADGAQLPQPTGRNPSMTIGALAERVAHLIREDA